jgi:photosystem II stability/assembly factor-like uncharacterized protein
LAALLVGFAIGGSDPAHAVAADAVPSPLLQPAIRSVHPASAVIVAVAPAGPRLVAAGEHGLILLSDDDGRSWRQARSVPVSVTLTALRFADPRDGWATGHMGVILHSGDGGETWRRELDGTSAAAAVLAEAEAEATSNPSALSAARLLVKDGPDKPFLTLLLARAGRVLAVGAYGLAFATDDDGRKWQPVGRRFDNPGELHLYALAERGGTIYAAGEQGLFLRADGNGRFERHATSYRGTLFGLLAPADGALLVYGLRGTVLRSEDDGRHWIAVETGIAASLTCDITLADGSILLGSMSGQFVASADGGHSFAPFGEAVAQPVAGCLEAADGAIVVVGPRGVGRQPLGSPAVGTP